MQHVALAALLFKTRPKSRNEKRIVPRLRQRKGQLWHRHTSHQYRCPILHLRGRPEEAIELRKANPSHFWSIALHSGHSVSFSFSVLFFILLRISHLAWRGECPHHVSPCTMTCFPLMKYSMIHLFLLSFCHLYSNLVLGVLSCVFFLEFMYRV